MENDTKKFELRDRKLGLPITVRLYASIVKAVLLYGAETWSLTKTETQRLDAAHHKWLRRILNKDMVHNQSIRAQSSQEKLELLVEERRYIVMVGAVAYLGGWFLRLPHGMRTFRSFITHKRKKTCSLTCQICGYFS